MSKRYVLLLGRKGEKRDGSLRSRSRVERLVLAAAVVGFYFVIIHRVVGEI